MDNKTFEEKLSKQISTEREALLKEFESFQELNKSQPPETVRFAFLLTKVATLTTLITLEQEMIKEMVMAQMKNPIVRPS